MIANICTTADRQDYLPKLVEMIAPYARVLTVGNDLGKRGYTWNFMDGLRRMLSMRNHGEAMMLCTDDTELCRDWHREYSRVALESGADAVCLFTRKRNVPRIAAESGDRGYVYGVFPRGFYDQAVVLSGGYWDGIDRKLEEWLDNGGREKLGKRANHIDVVLQEYLIDQNHPWAVTYPTLAEHAGAENSVLGHSVGRSILYRGDLL